MHLGCAGGAAGIHDVVDIGVGERGIGGLAVRGWTDPLVVVRKTRVPWLAADQHDTVVEKVRELALNALQSPGKGGIRQHQHGVGVLQQSDEAGFLEQRAARHDDDSRLGRRPVGGRRSGNAAMGLRNLAWALQSIITLVQIVADIVYLCRSPL